MYRQQPRQQQSFHDGIEAWFPVHLRVSKEMFDTEIWTRMKGDVRRALINARLPEFRTLGTNGSPGWIVVPMSNGTIARVVHWYPDRYAVPRFARIKTIQERLKVYDETLYAGGFEVEQHEANLDSDMPAYLKVSRPRQ